MRSDDYRQRAMADPVGRANPCGTPLAACPSLTLNHQTTEKSLEAKMATRYQLYRGKEQVESGTPCAPIKLSVRHRGTTAVAATVRWHRQQ